MYVATASNVVTLKLDTPWFRSGGEPQSTTIEEYKGPIILSSSKEYQETSSNHLHTLKIH